MAADFYNRRLFNDVFFVRYKGESEDRLRYLADELFDNVIRPSIFPGAYELIDKSRQLGLRQVLVTGRAGPDGAAARQAPQDRRLCDQPAGVRGRLRHRAASAADDGRRHEGQLDAHLRREGGSEPVRLLRLLATA